MAGLGICRSGDGQNTDGGVGEGTKFRQGTGEGAADRVVAVPVVRRGMRAGATLATRRSGDRLNISGIDDRDSSSDCGIFPVGVEVVTVRGTKERVNCGVFRGANEAGVRGERREGQRRGKGR